MNANDYPVNVLTQDGLTTYDGLLKSYIDTKAAEAAAGKIKMWIAKDDSGEYITSADDLLAYFDNKYDSDRTKIPTDTIFLLLSDSSSSDNVFDEYVWWPGDETLGKTGSFEKVGVFAADIANFQPKLGSGSANEVLTANASGVNTRSGVLLSALARRAAASSQAAGYSMAGKMASLNADGDPTDSGVAVADVARRASGATANNVAKLDSNGDPVDSGVGIADVARRAAGATANNIATLDSNGDPTDSGISKSDLQAAMSAANTALQPSSINAISDAYIQSLFASESEGE